MSKISAFSSTSGGGGGGTVIVTLPTNVECVVNTQGSGSATTITWSATTFAVEIINDDPTINVAIRFDGSAAVIPSNSSSISKSHLIRPKEARYFQVACANCSIIAASGTPQVRVTAWT